MLEYNSVCSGGVLILSKVDTVVANETKYIALVVLVLSALMEAIYLISGHWNYTVLLGNILGGGAGILNFFLMGLGIQNALEKDNTKGAKDTVSLSHTYRNIFLIAILAVAYLVKIFDIIPTVIALFFSSFGVYIKYFIMKKTGADTVDTAVNEGGEEE